MKMKNRITMSNQNSNNDRKDKNSFIFLPAIIVFVFLESLVVIQALLAWKDHIFTLSQMRQAGINQGLPFVWHFAMWGDLIIISGLAAYIIGRYSFTWSGRKVLVSLILGFAITTILSWTYTLSDMFETHVQNHHLTNVGIIHFFYMAFTLAVFIQFFMFTKRISIRLMRTTSLLLIIHVFIGTQMLLGIINAITPLDWYPAKPLRSIQGWLIFVSIVLSFLIRNVGYVKIVSYFKATRPYVNNILRLLINREADSYANYLGLQNYISKIVLGTLYFFQIAFSIFKLNGISISVVLLIVFGIVYYMSMLSVEQELEIVSKIFPFGRIPDEFKLKNVIKIILQGTGFTGMYILLGLFSQNIIVESACMLVIACLDRYTRKQINNKISQYFEDKYYSPQKNDSSYNLINNYRSVINWFLFQLPQLQKELFRIFGCAISFCVALLGHFNHSVLMNYTAYVILILTLIINEIITFIWRWKRQCRLRRVLYENN
jgi:hypothetical protein